MGGNPGAVQTEPGRSYPFLMINKAGGDHYRILVEGAPEIEERWVDVSCGRHLAEAPAAASGARGQSQSDRGTAQRTGRPESTNNLLAVSWQPAFCETSGGRHEPECRLLNDGRLDGAADGFSLHGLWPQPDGTFWCTKAAQAQEGRNWARMQPLALSGATRRALADVMPAVRSDLQRYQYYKHGSCYFAAGGAEEYYRDAIRLVDALNASAVGALFRSHRGKRARPAGRVGSAGRGVR